MMFMILTKMNSMQKSRQKYYVNDGMLSKEYIFTERYIKCIRHSELRRLIKFTSAFFSSFFRFVNNVH